MNSRQRERENCFAFIQIRAGRDAGFSGAFVSLGLEILIEERKVREKQRDVTACYLHTFHRCRRAREPAAFAFGMAPPRVMQMKSALVQSVTNKREVNGAADDGRARHYRNRVAL